MAEQISKDLEKAGSESMGSLIEMLNSYKSREQNCKEEIEKLSDLIVIKDNEIVELNEELNALTDFLENLRFNQKQKIENYNNEIKENKKEIKRKDKLIVDLQQRNELSQNAVNVT